VRHSLEFDPANNARIILRLSNANDMTRLEFQLGRATSIGRTPDIHPQPPYAVCDIAIESSTISTGRDFSSMAFSSSATNDVDPIFLGSAFQTAPAGDESYKVRRGATLRAWQILIRTKPRATASSGTFFYNEIEGSFTAPSGRFARPHLGSTSEKINYRK